MSIGRGSKMNKQFKLIPYPTVLFLQLFSVFLCAPIGAWSIADHALIILVVFLIVFSTIQLLIVMLSLLFWWNVPLLINSNGFSKKIKGKWKIFKWSDVQTITVVPAPKWLRIGKTGLFFNNVLTLSNGLVIKFEWSDYSAKKILNICNDRNFVFMYKKALEEG